MSSEEEELAEGKLVVLSSKAIMQISFNKIAKMKLKINRQRIREISRGHDGTRARLIVSSFVGIGRQQLIKGASSIRQPKHVDH